jgi:hypothetical protein
MRLVNGALDFRVPSLDSSLNSELPGRPASCKPQRAHALGSLKGVAKEVRRM